MPSREVTVLLFLRRVDCNDGVASYCETIVKGLGAHGIRTVIVSGPVTQLYGSATRRETIRENVLDWIVIDDLRANRPAFATLRLIIATIKKYRVNVISPQGFSLVPFAYALKALTRQPVVANYHPSMPGKMLGKIATSRSTKTKLGFRAVATLFAADRYIAISKDIEAFFARDCAIPKARIDYIPHGIDTTFFRPPSADERIEARSKFLLPDDVLVCVLPGRLNFDKGHDIAIEAARTLRISHPNLKIVCLFPGGGDHEKEIKQNAYMSAEDQASFQFLGFLDAETFRQAFWAADIVLLPSRFEGFGMVIAEAMSCGCVPIRTPSGGWQDQIVDGSNGYVVPFDDPAAMADRIARLANSAFRCELQANAIAFAREHFNQENMVASTAELYARVAEGKSDS